MALPAHRPFVFVAEPAVRTGRISSRHGFEILRNTLQTDQDTTRTFLNQHAYFLKQPAATPDAAMPTVLDTDRAPVPWRSHQVRTTNTKVKANNYTVSLELSIEEDMIVLTLWVEEKRNAHPVLRLQGNLKIRNGAPYKSKDKNVQHENESEPGKTISLSRDRVFALELADGRWTPASPRALIGLVTDDIVETFFKALMVEITKDETMDPNQISIAKPAAKNRLKQP